MKYALIFLFSLGFHQLFAQFGLAPGAIKVVNSKSTFGFSRPVCNVNADGNAVVMWGKRNNQDDYVAVENNGMFGTPVKLNPAGLTVFAQDWVGPDMAIAGNDVHVVFKSQPEESGVIYVVSSNNGGKTFGDTVRVSNKSWSRFPAVAVSPDGKNVYVAFMAFETDFKDPHYVLCTSNDGGKTFGLEVTTSVAPGEACDCCPCDVYANNDKVVVMFRNNDDNLRDMWAAISTDKGKSFAKVADIDSTDWHIGGCPSSGPHGFIDGDSLYTTWMTGKSGPSKVYVGTTSVSDLKLNINKQVGSKGTSDPAQNFPVISGSDGHMAVVWQELESGMNQVKLLYSNLGTRGLNSEHILRIDDNIGGAPANPYVHFDGETFRVVYQNNSKQSIYYREYAIDASTGIRPMNNSVNMSLHPNPVKGFMVLEAPLNSRYEIYTMHGVLLYSGDVHYNQQQIDVRNFASGSYILRLDSEGNSTAKRFYVTASH